MRVSLTATSHGLTRKQQDELRTVLRWFYRPGLLFEFHHGCCIGGDTEAHHIVRELFGSEATIIGWPAKDVGNKSTVVALASDLDIIKKPEPPLERNRLMVAATEVMIAAPRERRETQRSGTWATFRYAAERGLTTVMVYP